MGLKSPTLSSEMQIRVVPRKAFRPAGVRSFFVYLALLIPARLSAYGAHIIILFRTALGGLRPPNAVRNKKKWPPQAAYNVTSGA
jgi:hypothetical protein